MSDWRKVKDISIRYIDWGKEKWKYNWYITFHNWEKEEFKMKIRPDRATQYLQIMSDDIILSANELAERIKDSLLIDVEEKEISEKQIKE